MRLSNEPAHVPLTPATAQAIIAEMARLTQAELALHALTVTPLRAGEQAGTADAAVMQRIDTLASALATAMCRLASALRALVSPEPIPVLRPIQAQLRTEPAVTDNTVVGLTDRLVDAVNAIDAILRERFPLASGAHPPSA